MTMKSIITLSAALALATLVGGTSAEAKGCIKGAAAGGAAGSVAGHGKMGAAAGCAVGHSKANKKDQQGGGGGQGQPQQQGFGFAPQQQQQKMTARSMTCKKNQKPDGITCM